MPLWMFAMLVAVGAAGCSSSDEQSGADASAADSSSSSDAIDDTPFRVVVFSKTEGFRHASIGSGATAIEELAADNNFTVTQTEDSADLVGQLADTAVVVFLNTTGDIFDASEEAAFEAYIRGGGGWVGIHSAADTEYGWPFYESIVGAWFDNHPAPQSATVNIEVADHPATDSLPSSFDFDDEWYNFQTNPRAGATVLATLDETTYNGGAMGADHPITWHRQVDSGRCFYTGFGHRPENFDDSRFRDMLAGAIRWAAGRAE